MPSNEKLFQAFLPTGQVFGNIIATLSAALIELGDDFFGIRLKPHSVGAINKITY